MYEYVMFRKGGVFWRRVLAFDDSVPPAVASTFGVWLGSIPGPYDWATVWQVWPVCSIYGSVVLHTLVSLLLCLAPLCFRRNPFVPPHELVD